MSTPAWIISQRAALRQCPCGAPAVAEVTYTADTGGQFHGRTVLQCRTCWDRNSTQGA